MRFIEILRSFSGLQLSIRSVIFAIILISIFKSASANTSLYLDNTIDTPDRTLTYQGKNYEVKDIGVYHINETVNISINVTDINSFQLSLMDKNKSFLWNHMVYYIEGMSQVTMPFNIITEPGIYAFVVFYQGDILAIKPVVFSKYQFSLETNKTIIAPGGSLHIKVRLTPDTDLPVKVIFAQNSSTLESLVNKTLDGNYETDVYIPISAYGSFNLYAAVESGNMILGYPELVGVSEGRKINVTQIPSEPASLGSYFIPFIVSIFFILSAIVLLRKIRS